MLLILKLAIAYATLRKNTVSLRRLFWLRNCPGLPGKDPQDLLLCYRDLQKALVKKNYR